MTAYEMASYLDSLPNSGIIEFDLDADTYYVAASDASYEAVSDSTLRINGRTGYGTLALSRSSMLIDADEVRYVRHIEEIPT